MENLTFQYLTLSVCWLLLLDYKPNLMQNGIFLALSMEILLNYVYWKKITSYPERSNLGAPDYTCKHCNAIFWYQERIKSDSSLRQNRITYNSCCKGGKIKIPRPCDRPEPLASLARFNGGPTSNKFMRNIRQYYCLFAFTSMGANIDRTVNDGRGPPVFKIHG